MFYRIVQRKNLQPSWLATAAAATRLRSCNHRSAAGAPETDEAAGKLRQPQLSARLTQLGAQNMTCYESNCGSAYAGFSSSLAHTGNQEVPQFESIFGPGLGCAC